MDVGRLEGTAKLRREGLERGCKDVVPRYDNRGVNEGIFELGVAGEELGMQELGVLDVAEQGDMDLVVRWNQL